MHLQLVLQAQSLTRNEDHNARDGAHHAHAAPPRHILAVLN
ncbi:Uncharacterised protein [Vibrio cholerae]|nr:Uncharacterised protein [Vibrio cholerae]